MIDSILLAPYRLILKFRHFLYDKGVRKVTTTEVPSICVGNITVGGTGKTPHTEMLIRLLQSLPEWEGRQLAVLSRGYKRKSKGFQEVTLNGSARQFGDEPMQIKRKFPDVTVAVDRNRINGCKILAAKPVETEVKEEEDFVELYEEEPTRGADLIILDDAFQYRALKANVSIVLVDYNRPIFKDHLMPLGHLRDLPERITAADIVIVSKSPSYMRDETVEEFARKLKYKGNLFFTTTVYDHFLPIYPEGNPRYAHSPRMILFTGIANDKPLYQYLSLNFKIIRHISFSDHHKFTSGDVNTIGKLAEEYVDAVIATTEKDAQRLLDCGGVPDWMKERLFYVPVRADFLSPEEKSRFTETLLPYLS